MLIVRVSGLVNYWPVLDGQVIDLIAGKNPKSDSPTFTDDRNDEEDGAIVLDAGETIWKLPPGVYLSGDYTVTLWVKNLDCSDYNDPGK